MALTNSYTVEMVEFHSSKMSFQGMTISLGRAYHHYSCYRQDLNMPGEFPHIVLNVTAI